VFYFVHSSSRRLAAQITGPGRRLVLNDVNLKRSGSQLAQRGHYFHFNAAETDLLRQ
jgi:hypothetical protein